MTMFAYIKLVIQQLYSPYKETKFLASLLHYLLVYP